MRCSANGGITMPACDAERPVLDAIDRVSRPQALAPESQTPKLDPQTPKRHARSPALDPQTLDLDPPSVEYHRQTLALHSLSLALGSSSFKFSTSESRVPASDSRSPRLEGHGRPFDRDARLSEVENFEPKQRRSTVCVPCVSLRLWKTDLRGRMPPSTPRARLCVGGHPLSRHHRLQCVLQLIERVRLA